jgi:hypothetical protein
MTNPRVLLPQIERKNIAPNESIQPKLNEPAAIWIFLTEPCFLFFSLLLD